MPDLFSPCQIGPLRLKNRVIRAAAFEGMCPDNRPSPALLAYHQRVAEGGVGMTTVAYAAVTQSGLSFAHQLWLRPEVVGELRELTSAIKKAGAAASIQIGHCGNMAKRAVTGQRPIAPSSRINLYGPSWPRAMDRDDIAEVVKGFGEAVSLARDAGFDAVEVHAGHGYLISQFLSPHTNKRTDEYGGSLDHRLRFLREVMASVRKAARSDIAVLVKMNLRDGFPGGCELSDAAAVARSLEEEGADALVLSGGFVSRAPMYILRGAMPTRLLGHWMEDVLLGVGTSLFGQVLVPPVPYSETYFLEDACRIRDEVKIPLVYVGGVTSRKAIDKVLARGFVAVAMARALIVDPAFVKRLAAEQGAAADCDHCNYCAARIYTRSMACHRVDPPAPEVYRLLSEQTLPGGGAS